MAFPNPHTSDTGGQNLLTVGDYQYAVMYTVAGELLVCRRPRRGEWTTHQIAGAMRTEFDLPVEDDTHNYPTIARSSDGRLHLWANMHNYSDGIRYGQSDTSGTLSSFAEVDMPGETDRFIDNTYPNATQLDDGRVWYYMRAGDLGDQSGRGDGYVWIYESGAWAEPYRIFQGTNVPLGHGMGFGDDDDDGETDLNWNAYPTTLYVEQEWGRHPGRMHLSYCWRVGDPDPETAAFTNYRPSYIWSDDGRTWKNIQGRNVATPITPIHEEPWIFPRTHALAQEGLLNWGGITVDHNGYPHMFVSRNPFYHIYWDGSGWQYDTYGSTAFGFTLMGHDILGLGLPLHFDGGLWILATAKRGPTAEHTRLFKLDGTESYLMGGAVDPVGWEQNYDFEAWRLHQEISVLTPDNDEPRTVTFHAPTKVYI